MSTNKTLIKIGAYTLLVIGIIATLALLAVGVVVFVSYPDASLQKKAVIGGIFFIVAFLVLLLSISVFESMKELIIVEREVLDLEEEIEKKL